MKMKTTIALAIMMIGINIGMGQNLVPNGNFEDTVHCPTAPGDISAAKYWYKPTLGSTDYLNSCSNADIGVPNNYYGFQPAHSGNGYAAIFLSFDSVDLNYREYLQVKLLSPLVTNKRYIITVYIAKADSTPVAIKDIGFAFSNIAIGGNYLTAINFSPQIQYSSYITESENWTEISDTYTANGGEQYLTIGYFEDNNENDTMSIFYSQFFSKQAYYYIDDVSVYEDTSTSICLNYLYEKKYIYPNPTNTTFEINKSIQEIESVQLISTEGVILRSYEPSLSYDVSGIKPGHFLIKVFTKNKTITVYDLLIF